MDADGVPPEHRQGVEELVGLLYADTPLPTIFARVCDLARAALNAECVFLSTRAADGTLFREQSRSSAVCDPSAYERLAQKAVATKGRVFETGAGAAVAVPIRYGDVIVGALTAIDSRQRQFSEHDADLLEVYAHYVAIAQSNHAAVGRWLHRLRVEQRARWLVVIIALVLSAGLALYGWFAARLSGTQVLENARRATNTSSDHFSRFVATATQLASTTAQIAPTVRGKRGATERLLRMLLNSARSDVVYGIGVWYQPYAFSPKTRLFGPYVHHLVHGGVVLTYMWSVGRYDYPKHAWYRAGARAGTSTVFTPPYFDVDHVYVSAVHRMRSGRSFLGVSTVDMTSESIDVFLQRISSPGHIIYVKNLHGRITAFPNPSALIAYARTRHPLKRILDVTEADAQAFIRARFPKNTVTLRERVANMPLVLVDAWDPASLGGGQPPRELLALVGALIWALAAITILLLRHTRKTTAQTLDVHRERSRLLIELEERVQAERALRRSAEVDRMTGLSDRAGLMRALEAGVAAVSADAISVALLLVDLNNLEAINQAYGRETGDRVLIHVGALIRGCCGREDAAARFESDEFAVLVRGDARRRAWAIAECIQRGMSAGLEVDGAPVFFDSAAGLVEVSADHARAADVLRDADYALYYAKRTGQGLVAFTPQLRTEANREREIRAALRGALTRGEIFPVYQPLYHLRDRAVVGIEALARWKRADRIVQPAEFIPVAERSGLVLELDRYIARASMRFLSTLPDAANLALSVNVSALHFKHQATFESLRRTLERSRATKSRLNIELTETALMSLSGGDIGFVKQIHALGIGMHLDDFGTGYSSLSYLQHLHVDALKIDRSFVAAMLDHERTRKIVETIVQLAQRFGIDTIAEGIESAAQARALHDLGVSMGQGTFYAAPVPADEFGALAAR